MVKRDVFGEVIQERFTSETQFLNRDFFKPRLFTVISIVICTNKDIECRLCFVVLFFQQKTKKTRKPEELG